MVMSYDVRFWKTDVYRGARVTTYRVRWLVAQKQFKESFRTAALAESFRAQLVGAAASCDGPAGHGAEGSAARVRNWTGEDSVRTLTIGAGKIAGTRRRFRRDTWPSGLKREIAKRCLLFRSVCYQVLSY
jgi:hypothetical protein